MSHALMEIYRQIGKKDYFEDRPTHALRHVGDHDCLLPGDDICCLQNVGYRGGTNQITFFEGAGLIFGGVLIGYIVLVFRAV